MTDPGSPLSRRQPESSISSRLREEPKSDDTSADEGTPPKGAGWRGKGPPMEIGTGYSSREICDGQTLASRVGGPRGESLPRD